MQMRKGLGLIYNKRMKAGWLIVLLNLVFFISFSQPVKITQVVSENSITDWSAHKLILIDFWATWCGPCIAATEQLEILQKSKKDKLFIVSISDEPVPVIRNFLKKHPPNLLVAADFENYTFGKYNVRQRPYAVLIDYNGNIKWQGHPGELTASVIDRLYNQNYIEGEFADLSFWLEKVEEKKPNATEKPLADDEINMQPYFGKESDFYEENGVVFYHGPIKNLLIKLLNFSPYEVEIDDADNITISFSIKKSLTTRTDAKLVEKIISKAGLKGNYIFKTIPGYELKLENPSLLWDNQQFNWDDTLNNYLIGSNRLKADNITLKSLCAILSGVKNKYYFYNGDENEKHDWDFHFYYDGLMNDELETGFGIKITESNKNTKVLKLKRSDNPATPFPMR